MLKNKNQKKIKQISRNDSCVDCVFINTEMYDHSSKYSIKRRSLNHSSSYTDPQSLLFHAQQSPLNAKSQFIIILILKEYSKSYRGIIIEWLQISNEITEIIGLHTIPHYSALQKAVKHLRDTISKKLLAAIYMRKS